MAEKIFVRMVKRIGAEALRFGHFRPTKTMNIYWNLCMLKTIMPSPEVSAFVLDGIATEIFVLLSEIAK